MQEKRAGRRPRYTDKSILDGAMNAPMKKEG